MRCAGMVVVAVVVGFGQAQETERPLLYSGPAPTPAEKARRESLYRYAQGLVFEREDRVLDALEAFEEAAKLDPDAAAPVRAQARLLVLLDRPREAVAKLQASLKLAPDEPEDWLLLGRLHKGLGESKEHGVCLEKALALPGVDPGLALQMHLELAAQRELARDPGGALRAYQAAATLLDRPEGSVERAAQVYEKIGDLHRQLKNPKAAIGAYEAALRRDADLALRVRLVLARTLREANRPADALAQVDAYLRWLPQGLEAYRLKIDLLESLGRRAEIVAWLRRASDADAFNVGLKLLLAERHAAADDVGSAETLCRELFEQAPSEEVVRTYFSLFAHDAQTLGSRALTMLDQAVKGAKANRKDPDEDEGPTSPKAAEQVRSVLAALRNDARFAKATLDEAYRPRAAREPIDSTTHSHLAPIAEKHGRLDQAERFYRGALQGRPQRNEPSLYFGLLRTLWTRKEYEEIVRVCRDGLDRSQFTAPILFHSYLSRAYSRLNRLREAEQEADAVLDLAGDRDRNYGISLKLTALTLGDRFDEAISLARKAVEEAKAPDAIVSARLTLSSVLSQAKRYDLAEKELFEILRLDPNHATAHNNLGYQWAEQGKHLKEAEEMIRRAIELDRRERKLEAEDDQDRASFVDSLGWALFRRGFFEEAKRELERAVKLPDGDDATLWDHLGDVYFRLGARAEARRAWERSIELFRTERVRPGDERFRDAQRKLKLVSP